MQSRQRQVRCPPGPGTAALQLQEFLPALAGGAPAGTVWDGPVFYEETRERAEQTATSIDKADRASTRDARMMALFDRWDAWTDRVSRRAEQHLDRLGPS